LFSGDAERWTRNSTCDQVGARKIFASKTADVLLQNIPLWPVLAQCCAIMRLAFHDCHMVKSGFPGNGRCLRQPLIPCARRMDASLNSVSLLPFDRMAAMTWERFRFEKTSAIDSRSHFTEIASLLKARRALNRVVRFADKHIVEGGAKKRAK
jgi:hypothetical protein